MTFCTETSPPRLRHGDHICPRFDLVGDDGVACRRAAARTPRILMTSVPAPVTFAPMALRKLARSTICGSFAAFSMTVVPLARTPADHNIHRRADGDDVQVDSAADQASGAALSHRRSRPPGRTSALHGLNTLDVLVDGPHTEVASAGQRHAGMAEPAQLRADEIIGGAGSAHQRQSECARNRVTCGAVRAPACSDSGDGSLRPSLVQNLQQEPDVGDIGNIFNFTNTFDQQASPAGSATAAFFAPLIVTVPCSGLPPFMIYFVMEYPL